MAEYQGRGSGRLLFEEVVRHIDKNNHTILEVAKYNQKAIGFYEKFGFAFDKDL